MINLEIERAFYSHFSKIFWLVLFQNMVSKLRSINSCMLTNTLELKFDMVKINVKDRYQAFILGILIGIYFQVALLQAI